MTTALNLSLPTALKRKVDAALEDWRHGRKLECLWARDASLWTGTDEGEWLGWLDVAERQLADLDRLRSIADDVRGAGFSHSLLLGMGGSSLCAGVLGTTFGRIDGYPELHVLDSTDPAQVRRFEGRVEVDRTLFIVASKSGTTLEPDILRRYFFRRVQERVGRDEAGRRFIAITDPGSKLQVLAEADGFRHIAFGEPGVGGRYSALSSFGMLPAAVMGLDVARLLRRAHEMVGACGASVPVDENPGLVLGAVLGALGRGGRDKVTFVITPPLQALGAWLEQLVAESTGKDGIALIPVDDEGLGPPEVYGDDRLFVYLRLEPAPDPDQDDAVAKLEAAGQPVVRVSVADPYDLGREFFRWEFATAVAGSILGINPFIQPDVEASKVMARKLMEEYEAAGSLPAESPILEEDGLTLFADERNADVLGQAAGGGSLTDYLRAHLSRLGPGDYFALLAYIDTNEANRAELQAVRRAVRDGRRVATALGFGPRFLHSTGQAYKGGPNSGVFLQITCDDAADLAVPGRAYTFSVVKAAQARGDFQVLAARKRRALRVHLGLDVVAGLGTMRECVAAALS